MGAWGRGGGTTGQDSWPTTGTTAVGHGYTAGEKAVIGGSRGGTAAGNRRTRRSWPIARGVGCLATRGARDRGTAQQDAASRIIASWITADTARPPPDCPAGHGHAAQPRADRTRPAGLLPAPSDSCFPHLQ